jgi:hypothetical protein
MQTIHLPSQELKITQGSSLSQLIIVTYYTTWLKTTPLVGGFCLHIREQVEGQGVGSMGKDPIHKCKSLNKDQGNFPRSMNKSRSALRERVAVWGLKPDCRKAGNFIDIDDPVSLPCSLPTAPLHGSVSLHSSKLNFWSNIRLSFFLERRLCQG